MFNQFLDHFSPNFVIFYQKISLTRMANHQNTQFELMKTKASNECILVQD